MKEFTVQEITDLDDAKATLLEIKTWFEREMRCAEAVALPEMELLEGHLIAHSVFKCVDEEGMVVGFTIMKGSRALWHLAHPLYFTEIANVCGREIKKIIGESPWGVIERDEMRSLYLLGNFDLASKEPYGEILVRYNGE